MSSAGVAPTQAQAQAQAQAQQLAAPAGVIELSSCRLPDVAQSAWCGVLDVPENPHHAGGRLVPIHVAVIRASSGKSLPDPIVLLMGGPGEDAISAAAVYAAQLAPLLVDRDLLLVDQRGTGLSGALRCKLYSSEDPAANLRDLFPLAAVESCERRLSTRADLTQYGYTRFADDLEEVRRSLGYGSLNLFGGSYGTRGEQVYLRAYPRNVRTAYFGSVVPIDLATPIAMAKTAQVALEGMFDACAADAACSAAFPNSADEFRTILVRLETTDTRVHIRGNTNAVRLYPGPVVAWIRSNLYRPTSAAVLPWAIDRAYAGDWSPIVDGILSGARDSDLSFGLFFSITCNEDVAFMREADVLPATRGTFLGDYRVRQQQAACKYWPRVALPARYRTAVRSSVPALFVTGDADGGTPVWYTQHAIKGFSNAVEVVARGQGHTEWNDCVGRLYQRLVHTGSVRGLETSSCEAIPRPPFKTG